MYDFVYVGRYTSLLCIVLFVHFVLIYFLDLYNLTNTNFYFY